MKPFRILLTLLAAALGAPLAAACLGEDIRDTFSAQDKAAIQAELAGIPYNSGNHWIARKNGRQIHFVGTMHFNDARMDAIAENLMPVLSGADAVLFETTTADMETFQKSLAADMSPVLITNGPTLPELMTDDGWARLSEITRKNGIPPWMAAKMRPWFLSTVLAVPACLRNSPNPDYGLDRRIGEIAETLGIPQVSLEAVETVIAVFDKHPLEEQVRMIELTIDMMGGSENDMFTMAQAYFEERPAEAMLALEMSARQKNRMPADAFDALLKDFRHDILTLRNRNWMPVILNQPGDRIVVAVGAAHLSGDAGLLQFMKNQGYRLERARF